MQVREQRKDFANIDYRFSFALTISDFDSDDDIIIVKRDFNINNLDEESLYSIELKECVDDVVTMIDRDLKSKSRVYTWYNYDENYVTLEFSEPLPEKEVSTFKFTLFDGKKPVISKIWSGDEYPFNVRNSVDLTNKKYNNSKPYELDFTKQIAQKASADKPDLTIMIMKHISSTCASFRNGRNNKKMMYKQHIPELKFEEIVIKDPYKNEYSYIKNKLPHKFISTDDTKGGEKIVYEVYTTKYDNYDLSPNNNISEKEYLKNFKRFFWV